MSEPVYTPNSHKYKEQQKENTVPEKRVQKVVKNPVKIKSNEARKLADIFISEDVENVKNYIFMDVIVPAIKKAIYDVVTNGIDMFLYGGSGKGRSNNNSNKVNYRTYYDQRNNNSNVSYRGSENNSNRNGFEYEDIVFNNRGEAEAAKQQMMDIISRYGMVTVADLYEMSNETAPYTAHKYGWIDVSGADTIRVRDGYKLRLPKAVPLD